ncbi:MAG: hypothetical protein V2J62_07170 [candidate division KSB1 bacterium]|jgi:hypothetical protein|nr:hypothetical protein [candidate division KSB1 bacterium]
MNNILIKVIGLSLIILIIGLFIMYVLGYPQFIMETAIGYVLCLFISASAFLSIQWGVSRSLKTFMAVMLFGMAARFILFAIALLLLMRYTAFDVTAIVVSFFIFFIIFQYFEIRFINKSITNGREIFKSIIQGK